MTARRPPPPIGTPAFAELKALIVAETGHHYYEDKDVQLGEHVARRMTALGIADTRLYLERLRDVSAGPREWRLLESELTINETFFFRFAEQFAALREEIVPRLIARHAADRRLRIWSAGCANGAEPYSVAVVVHDLLGPALDDWHVSILGTDIDEATLAEARTATFGGWALRAVDAAERARLFEADGKRWRLRAPYRGMVRFDRQNVLDLLDPLAPAGRGDYDLILCRNLLIYFRPDIAARLVAALEERLAPGGRLLLGHAEAGLASAEVARSVADALPPPALFATHAKPPVPPRRPRRPAPRRPAPPPAAPPALDDIRALLARGETAAARALIARRRVIAGGEPLLLYLDALGAAAEGDEPAAERAFRGVLYLDHGFAMAHYLLGRQLLAAGHVREGRRALVNAADALAGAADDAAVPEGEGLTAADLRAAIRHRLEADAAPA